MLKKRLNKEDNIASELLDNIFIQVNSMSDLVNNLDYVNSNSNTLIDNDNNNNNVIYIENGNIINDSNVNDVIKDDNSILVANDIDDEIWIPVKEEIDINIDDDINNNNNDRK
jgi:hypothetical protein